MSIYLVVEGDSDRAILERVLPADALAGCSVVVANGRARLTTVASSLLIKKQSPVALICDADTVNGDRIRDQRELFEMNFLRFAGRTIVARIIFAIPEIEGIFFVDPEIVGRVVGQPIPESIQIEARYAPKQAIEAVCKMFGRRIGISEILSAIGEADIVAIRLHPFLREIVDFIETARNEENVRLHPAGAVANH
jgi:hypothetical protein